MGCGVSVFVSDVHLAGRFPRRLERFRRFLSDLPARARALYILGDLFDFWVGPGHARLDRAPEVLAALADVVKAGVEVSFVSGNRDFFLAHYLLETLGVRAYPDAQSVELDGRRVLLSHGDALCTRDRRYLRLRRILRSGLFRRLFTALPPEMAYYMGSCLRSYSRRVVRTKHHSVVSLDPAEIRRLFSTGIDVLICGHVHRPAHEVHEIGGRRCELFVLDDWSRRPGWLEYADGRFSRQTAEDG